MRSFCSIGLLLLVSLVLSMGAAITWGQHQPASAQLTSLHLTDCAMPCWAGIVPGQTTLREARQRLQRLFAESADYQLALEAPATSEALWVTLHRRSDLQAMIAVRLYALGSVIDEIDFEFPVTARDAASFVPTVVEFYSQLGIPSRLTFTKENFALAFGEGMCRTLVIPDTGVVLHWTDLTTALSLCAPVSAASGYRWRGFVPLQSYEH